MDKDLERVVGIATAYVKFAGWNPSNAVNVTMQTLNIRKHMIGECTFKVLVKRAVEQVEAAV